jgi:KipI family sensor histidine kinase inhibitor
VRALAYGGRGTLVECTDTDEALALLAALAGDPPVGMVDAVAGARTVLVVGDVDVQPVLAWPLPGLAGGAGEVAEVTGDASEVEIPVAYDGPDLAEIAELAELSEAQVVDRHTAVTYTVAFTGFAPGFGYLTGLDPALRMARRETPRERVPAGSVAIAGEYAGVYPRESPGGWRLLGRTDVAMWDLDRDPPALLRPGVRVRFTAR